MGNLSLALPSIHPTIGIDSLPAVYHQPEFTASCATPAADQAVVDEAVAMAWTAIDAAAGQALRERLLAGPGAGPDVRERPAAPTSLVSACRGGAAGGGA